jgi:hypothetical protein
MKSSGLPRQHVAQHPLGKPERPRRLGTHPDAITSADEDFQIFASVTVCAPSKWDGTLRSQSQSNGREHPVERWILAVSAEHAYQLLGPYASELERLHALGRLTENLNGNVLALDLAQGKRPVIRSVTTLRGFAGNQNARNGSSAKPAAAAPRMPQHCRAAISPDTRIDELDLKPKALSLFRGNGLKTLRDLAALPEAGLLAQHGIGPGTVEKLRSILLSAGLGFAPPPDPLARLHWENRQRRAEVIEPAATVPDDARVSALGLLPAALSAATRRGLKTVSDLVGYTPLELSGIMSTRAVRDTMERLTLFGRSLQPESPRRLNGFGLIERSEYFNGLSARTPVKELRHLLGVRAASALRAAGFEAAGDLLSRSLPEKLSERDRMRVDRFVLELRMSLETRRGSGSLA